MRIPEGKIVTGKKVGSKNKTPGLKLLKDELQFCTKDRVIELCLRLGRHKKENKELLGYLLLYSDREQDFVKMVKEEIDRDFELINTSGYYYMRKSIRKILKMVKKNIRFSGKRETEAELLLYFCRKMERISPSIRKDKTLFNIFKRQITLVEKRISTLDEDLQYDYMQELKELGN